MNTTEEVLAFWRSTMAAAGLAPQTVKERIRLIQRLDTEAAPILAVGRPAVIAWLAKHQTWTPSTRAHNRGILFGFFTWMQDEGIRIDNPAVRLPKVRTSRREPTPFAVSEIQALLDGGMYSKTRVMVVLHYYLGLRVSEIARVHGRDIDWNLRTLRTIGKGKKEVVMPIPPDAWAVLSEMPRDAWWFPNRQDNKYFKAWEGHIHGRSVSDTLHDAIVRAGLNHRPHDLRAATATEMHRAGVSAFTIQESMRHSNMQTTLHYMRVSKAQVVEGLAQLPTLTVPRKSARGRVSASK